MYVIYFLYKQTFFYKLYNLFNMLRQKHNGNNTRNMTTEEVNLLYLCTIYKLYYSLS